MVSLERMLRVTTNRSIILLPLFKVCLMVSKDKYLDVHDRDGKIHLVEDSLTRLMKVTTGFVWLSRSAIAREECLLQFRREDDYHVVVVDPPGVVVRLSRRRMPEVRAWFNNRSV